MLLHISKNVKSKQGDGGHAANYTRKELHQLRQENQEQQTVIRNLISTNVNKYITLNLSTVWPFA